MDNADNMPQSLDDPRIRNAALDLYVATQVAYADPEFFQQYSGIILKTASIDTVTRMRWDLEVYFPKLDELRRLGKISSVQDAVAGSQRIVSTATDISQIFGLSQMIAHEEMPKSEE
jgi:hypothetical protein